MSNRKLSIINLSGCYISYSLNIINNLSGHNMSYSWKTIEDPGTGDTSHYIKTLVTPLSPWTKYAIYVQAIMLKSARYRSISDVVIFTTSPTCEFINLKTKTPQSAQYKQLGDRPLCSIMV